MENEKHFWRNKYFFAVSAAAVLANILSWILIFSFLRKGGGSVILHYNILFGVDYQGSQQKLFTIPTIGIIAILMNLTIARLICAKEKFISNLLLFASLVVQLCVIIAVSAIIFVNRYV